MCFLPRNHFRAGVILNQAAPILHPDLLHLLHRMRSRLFRESQPPQRDSH